jgi:hypothetical protein
LLLYKPFFIPIFITNVEKFPVCLNAPPISLKSWSFQSIQFVQAKSSIFVSTFYYTQWSLCISLHCKWKISPWTLHVKTLFRNKSEAAVLIFNRCQSKHDPFPHSLGGKHSFMQLSGLVWWEFARGVEVCCIISQPSPQASRHEK